MGRECVYFIGGVDGPIKIGKAKNVKSRLAGIQTGHPYKLDVIGTMLGRVGLESAIHQRFKHIRLNGEWFSRTEELVSFIDSHSIGLDLSSTGKVKEVVRFKKIPRERIEKFRDRIEASVKARYEKKLADWTVANINNVLRVADKLFEMKRILEDGEFYSVAMSEHLRMEIRRLIDHACQCEWQESNYILRELNEIKGGEKYVKRILNCY